MQALIYQAAQRLSFTEATEPQPSADEVVVEVHAAGICGSDMHAYLGHDERRPPPLILGHEASGIVASGPRQGGRVTANPLVSCGVCPACRRGQDNLCPQRQIISMPPRPGAFAQYFSIPAKNLIEVPDHFPLDTACLAEPLACGWHAVRLARQALPTAAADCRALVLGAGAIGVGSALALAAQGIKNTKLLEPNGLRREYLSSKLACPLIAPDELHADQQFELIFDAVGTESSRALASERATPGGVIAHIGLGSAHGGLDIRRMTLQEISFIGTYTYTSADFAACAAAMFSGELGALDWHQSYPLAEGAEAFAALRQGKVAAAKLVLRP